MNHDHDHHHNHANMVTTPNSAVNHAHHVMSQQVTTNSMSHSGHGSHTKDMMMAVSIKFTLFMKIPAKNTS